MAAVLVASSIALLVGPASQQVRAETEADILIGDPISYTDLGIDDVDIGTLSIDSKDPSRVIGTAYKYDDGYVHGLAITTSGDTAILGETQPLYQSEYDTEWGSRGPDGAGLILLDESRAVSMAYKAYLFADDAVIDLRILTIDGENQFTVGPKHTLDPQIRIRDYSARIAALDADRFVLSYIDYYDSYMHSVVCTVNGDDITVGESSVFSGAKDAMIASLDADHFLVYYTATTPNAPNMGTAMVATVTGNTVTYGSPTTFMVTQDVYYAQDPSITVLDANRFVICSQAYDEEVEIKVATIDGTSISIGEPVTFPFYADLPRLVVMDDSHFVWAYVIEDPDTYETTTHVVLASVDGDAITFGEPIEYPHGRPIFVVSLEPTRFGIIGVRSYSDQYPVGAICTVPSLAAPPAVAPTMTSISPTEAVTGELYSCLLTADMDVVWTLISGPEWLSLIGNDLSGTPIEAGQYDVMISFVCDGHPEAYEEWTITVVPELVLTNTPAEGTITYVVL
ncbi:hypothetical protein AOA80_03645 [Methanomassiliicoccales archaeon RumEn M1]|nr:hypothetical protein AOA80_03645 [Methanomassiliicoccales archaeon RumEn M1]